MHKKIIATSLLVAFLTFSAFGLKSCGNGEDELEREPVELTYWRLWDDSDIFDPLIEAYQEQFPYVSITYRKLTFDEYESTVTDALAEGKGPDIWSIHNTWLPKHKAKLAPAPQELIPLDEYQNTFVDVVSQDFVDEGEIYAVPLATDTLAMYYNKDLLNTAFIVEPPENWTDFMEAVEKLTKTDELEDIEQAGAAIGTASNVNRAPDILSLLMLQNDTQMVNADKTQATFDLSNETSTGESYFPGLDALIFYTDFANPKKPVHTWTPTLPNSIDAFVAEKTAIMFSYAYQQEVITSKAPKLNFDVAPMPQIKDTPKEVNYPNYWAEVVSKSSENQEEAWKFLSYLSQADQSRIYLEETGRPAARKDLISEQLENPKLKVFAGQALTAKSWYQNDPAAIDNIFSRMIDSVVLGEAEPEDALSTAKQQVTATMD